VPRLVTRFLTTLLFIFAATLVDSTFAQTLVTNTYTVSDEDFANPERGFYLHTETRASAPASLPANLGSFRVIGRSDPNDAYTTRLSLVLRVIYLDTFVNAPISTDFLNTIQADFDFVRTQGFKAVVRLAYNQDTTRPFNEPTKARILEHIGQLMPLLRRNHDVIAVLQQGFIGAWGEGYYTDVFSTAGQAFTAQNWTNRAEVLNALLAALPPERMVQVRVPQQKQKHVYGVAAPTSSPAIDSSQAHNGNAAARIAFHNDCFLADNTDLGTFTDYDGVTEAQDIVNLRNYAAMESRYVAMGGETCIENAPDDDCASVGGRADADLSRFHYSFLNQGYNANVNDDWVAQGCIEDIKRRLGYRLQLVSGIFRTEASPGQTFPLTLELQNVGYAAPFNPRGMELVLRHTTTGQRFFAELSRDFDARFCLPGSNHVLTATLASATNLPLGSYEMLLHLPDPAPLLYGLVPYSIRLANSNAISGPISSAVWEPATGYHHLGHTLTVNNTATNTPTNATAIPVLDYSAIRETYDTWRTRHFPSDPLAGEPHADPDMDGWSNLLEYAVGSDPNSGVGRSHIEATYETGAFLLTIRKGPGVKDVRYEVEGSPDLSQGSWSASLITTLANNAALLRVRFNSLTATGFLRLTVVQD
jgi:hypothetical protein